MKLSVVPPRARRLRHGRAAPPRRRPAGGRVQHVGRLALDAAAQARASTSPSAAALLLVDRAARSSLIALAIRLERRGPVFYVQTRAGLGGREFRMYKFRTMRAGRRGAAARRSSASTTLDEPMFKLTRDPRVTRLGRVLRRTSLDELPQLVNVLQGRDEPRRPAAGAGRARAALPARAPVPARGEAGADRADAGLRPRRASTSRSGSRSSATTSRTSRSAATCASSRSPFPPLSAAEAPTRTACERGEVHHRKAHRS